MSISDAELARRRAENARIYPRFPLGDPSADGFSSPFESAVALVRRPTAKLRNESIDQIPLRLLILKKGWDTVECELKVDNLQESPDYEALSYAWGDSKDLVEIKCCGQTFSIGRNLQSALKRLRSSTGDRILWIDAICINQADKQERAEQVAFMGRIYGAARHALVWLGEPAEDVTAFDTITELSKTLPERKVKPSTESNLSQISNVNAEYPSHKNALNEVRFRHLLSFFSRSWFERVWVIQEVSRAKNVVVMSGKQVLPWEKFIKVVLSFSDAISYLKKEYGPEESLRGVIALDNLPAMDSLRRNNEKMSLFAILCVASTYKSTDERDKLFALLALGNRASIRVQPDYISDFFHVFRRHVIYELEERHRLDYLARPPIRRTDWPSWVPDWTESSRSSYFYTAMNHGFRAAGDTEPILGISKDKKVLSIKGKIVDYVDVLVDPINRPWKRQLGIDSENVRPEELFQWFQECMACVPVELELVNDYRKNSALHALLRTFACTGVRGSPRKGYFSPSLSQSDTASIKRTLKDIYAAKRANRDLSPALIALASQLYPAVADRQFFKSTESRLGWVSKRAIRGDAVCVLLGGAIPFVLRHRGGDEWKIIGECYVDGLMQGEAMQAEDGGCTFRIT
jgi:Heterokaryon incompatibility protein (HET)